MVGLRGRQRRRGAHDHDEARVRPVPGAVLRLPDVRRRARHGQVELALLYEQLQEAVQRALGRAIRRSNTSSRGPIGRKTSSRRSTDFSPTSPPASSRAFTWVTPLCVDSDHLDCGGGFGPSWVASVVNAVGESKFWDSTVVFVQWDDWGGLYDPVPPPFKDYDGIGFRVPLIVISPYAKKDFVSHKQYETASVLRFAEDLFGLRPLSAADTRAKSPAKDCLDFSQKPRKFVPIKAPQDAKFFLNQPLDDRIPDARMSRRWPCVALAFALAACSHGSAVLPYMQGGAALGAVNAAGAGKIQHVVWVVQENRSFNDMFEGYPGAYTVSSGKDSHGKTIALQPVSLKKVYDIEHRSQRYVRGVRRHGQPSGNRLPDGRLRSRSAAFGGPTNPRVRLRAADGVEALLGHGARVRAGRPHVPVAARRELRRAPIHHRRAGAIERRRARGSVGLRGRKARSRVYDHEGSRLWKVVSGRASTTRRSATSSTRPGLTLALLYEQLQETVDGGLWSGYQAVRHILLRPRLEERRHHAAAAVPHRRRRRQARERSRGSRRSAASPITSIAAADTGRRGSRRWSTRSARASSGIRRRSSCSGTTGAASTIPCRRRLRITTATASACR